MFLDDCRIILENENTSYLGFQNGYAGHTWPVYYDKENYSFIMPDTGCLPGGTIFNEFGIMMRRYFSETGDRNNLTPETMLANDNNFFIKDDIDNTGMRFQDFEYGADASQLGEIAKIRSLENDDLCLRVKQMNENIYIIKQSLIDHLGASSSGNNQKNEIEYLRNWHWMWSKFYFNKKHYGYLNAFIKVFLNLVSAKIKFIYYLMTINLHKRKIYQMRISGLLNSMSGKKSYYRLKN